MPKKGLIINADDFGYNTEVNRAILATFSKGLCSSTTIMANMSGFEEACQLCHKNDLTDRVGLHLVLSEGVPLSDDIKKCQNICDDDGQFHSTRSRHYFKLTAFEKIAFAKEISAQIDRCRKFGISLTHIDSHCHIHAEWSVTNILLKIVKDKGIRYIRLSRHLDPDSIWIKNLYRRYLNFRFVSKGVAATKYFGTVEDFVRLRKNSKHSINSFEIMIHPVFNKEKVLIDNISKKPLVQYVANIYGYENAVPFSYISNR